MFELNGSYSDVHKTKTKTMPWTLPREPNLSSILMSGTIDCCDFISILLSPSCGMDPANRLNTSTSTLFSQLPPCAAISRGVTNVRNPLAKVLLHNLIQPGSPMSLSRIGCQSLTGSLTSDHPFLKRLSTSLHHWDWQDAVPRCV